jgi:hypothetical protein
VRLQEIFLYFFGHLQFTGPDGVTRDSAFFRFHSPISGTFETGEDPDPDYEHY